MPNWKKLLSILLIIFTLFIGIKETFAETEEAGNQPETEVYCRYVFNGNAHSGNIVSGLVTGAGDVVSNVTGAVGDFLFDADWDFYNKNALEHGVLAYTIVDIVKSNGGIEIKSSASSRLFAQFDSKLDSTTFYKNGEFDCPKEIYANHDGESNNGYTRLTLFTNDTSWALNILNWDVVYTFVKKEGPVERNVDYELINMSDVSCSGILGPFKKDLEGGLKIIRLLAPIIILFFGTYDYIAATLSKDADLLKKANSRLRRRLILMAVLFFLPTILNLFLGIIDSSYTSCIR